MRGYSRVILIGNLAREPQLRYLPSGDAVVSFTVCVARNYRASSSGQVREETSFIPVVVHGRQAEICNTYLKKGSPVFIDGRLRQRSWETQDGQRRTILEVIASTVQFLAPATPVTELAQEEEEIPIEGLEDAQT